MLALQTRNMALSSSPSAEPSPLYAFTAHRHQERIEATVLFADIVGSTELIVQIGDDCWADLLRMFYLNTRQHVAGYHGHLLGFTGDGFHASFRDPLLAAQCALALLSSTRRLGLRIRIGMHFGQYLNVGDLQVGLTLHVTARIAAAAHPNEVLMSEPLGQRLMHLQVTKLIALGDYSLKGLPGEWRLFRYEPPYDELQC
jgi:class 3 adenylate cyclase